MLGFLELGTSCRIALAGPTWKTLSEEPVPCGVEVEGDAHWLSFPFETAAGEGEASLRIQGEPPELVLPLGAREGEHDQGLTARRAPQSPGVLAQALATSSAEVDRWRAAWKAGVFRLRSGDDLVGGLQFRGEARPVVDLYDVSWMTSGPVEAMQLDQGPDLVLLFDAEPSFGEDPFVLRVNRPTNGAVVPLGVTPSPVERTYRLVPGTVSPEEREEARALATMGAGQRELTVSLQLAAGLAEALTDRWFLSEGDTCPALSELSEDWQALLVGYRIEVVREERGCGVELEPVVVQHGRRLAARIGADGMPRESVLRGL